MPWFQWTLPAAILIGALAGGLRFHKIGDWSYSHDELATYQEIDSLMHGAAFDDPQTNRLPRLIPLPFYVQGLAAEKYGRDEWSARLPSAISGTALAAAVVLFGWRALGGWTASALGLIICFNVEHLFQSQNHRFYAFAALFAGLAAVLGADALFRKSLLTMIAACLCVMLGMLSHTLVAGVFVLLLAAAFAHSDLQPVRKPFLVAIVSLGLIAGAGFAVALYPQLQGGWNTAENWGYSPARAILGGMNLLGWPVACLAGLGIVAAAFNRWTGSVYWGLWLLAWAASVILLPRLIRYHPAYSLPFAIGPFVFAAYFVGTVSEMLAEGRNLLAVSWLLGASVLHAPSVASHYVDGSRHDFRAASRYIAEKKPPRQPLYAMSSGFLRHYEPKRLKDCEHILNGSVRNRLQEIRGEQTYAWIVLIRNRNGYDEDVQIWLNQNCMPETTIRHPRYDYYEYAIDVFRMIPP